MLLSGDCPDITDPTDTVLVGRKAWCGAGAHGGALCGVFSIVSVAALNIQDAASIFMNIPRPSPPAPRRSKPPVCATAPCTNIFQYSW